MVDITDLVKQDLEQRAILGSKKYGARLSTEESCHNDVSALQNAYEEALDLAVYLKKALLENKRGKDGEPKSRTS